jgi:hypothetical protein
MNSMKSQPETTVAPPQTVGAANGREPDRNANRKRTYQIRAGSGKTMALSYLLAEREELSSHLVAVEAAHADIWEALATSRGDSTVSIQEPLRGYASLCGSFRYSTVVDSLHELDHITLFDPDNLILTNASRFVIDPLIDDDADRSLTPRQRAARAILRRRLALAAFLARVFRNRLKTVCRGINLILRQRTAHEQRCSMFAREIPWFLQHGCHPPADPALRFNGPFSSGTALTS